MKRALLIVIITVCATITYAQKEHYLFANIGGGLHNIDYVLRDVSKYDKECGYDWSGRIGFMGEIGWQWFFTKHFGVGLGAGFSNLGAKTELNFTQTNANLTDNENGMQYNELISYNNFQERQRQTVMNLPFTLYYRTSFTDRMHLIVGVSALYTSVLSQKYKTIGGNISTGKYFPDLELNYSGLDDKEHGVYTVSDFSGDTKLQKTLYGVRLHPQFCYDLNNDHRISLLFGMYFANNFGDQRECYNGDLYYVATNDYKGITQCTIGDRVNSIYLGLSAGIRIRVGGKEKPKKEEEEPLEEDLLNMPKL